MDNEISVHLETIIGIGDAAAAILGYAGEHDDGVSDPTVPRYMMNNLGRALDDLTEFLEHATGLIKQHGSQVRN